MTRLTCSNCGAENEAGRKFCGECASPLALVCPSCSTSNPTSVKFCGECGTALLTGARPASAADQPTHALPASASGAIGDGAPVAERRLVSVLFTDLVGFTTLSEGRDAEDVRELLSRYFDRATATITRHGGIVEKFIGDAVMAVWGSPVAREDDAERAVRAALELVEAVPSLGPGVQARGGVLTGEAAVTLGATNQGMVAGDMVNTAARLQSAAAPGTVLVGETTVRAAGRAIVFEPIGEQSLKGKAAPVPAWRAVRVVATGRGRGRSDALEAPFVGRDDELRLLKDLYEATVREGRARLVSVTGIGGIGKSRLAWELEKYLDGIPGPVWSHRGRSPAYGSGITFWALGEMIRGRAGLVESDDESTTRERIGHLLDTLVLTDDERRWIEPALLALLGIDSGAGPEQLFGAWRTFFERLAATGPVVLVFEDLHWADAGTLDFIDHLLEWSRTIPLYIVTLARPELQEKRADWGAGRRNFTSLYLEPLAAAAMRELLSGLVPGLPEPAVASIVARAEGIPLYAVETVRNLVADGWLMAAGDGTYAATRELTGLPIPETLTAVIAARLDALEPEERSLVLDAAVLGHSFSPTALAAVAGTDEAALEPRLRSLARREILVREVDPRSPERGQYAFVQALIREVAYNTLAKRDRKSRHLAAARFFESLGSGELAAALADHYVAARDNAPEGPERDALAAQARVALTGAGERAAGLGDHDGAASFFDQALTVSSEPADRAELLERSGREASIAGRHDAAERHLRAALALRRELDDRPALARVVTALGGALLADLRRDAAIALLEPAVAEFADVATDPAVIALESQLARVLLARGDSRRAIDVADRVLETAEHADLRALIADTLVTKGSALADLGRSVEGLGVVRAGTRLAETEGLEPIMSRGYNQIAAFGFNLDPKEAVEAARSGLVLARRLGYRHESVAILGSAAEGAFRTGDWDWAMGELDTALADDYEATDRLSIVAHSCWLRSCRGDRVDELLAEIARLVALIPGTQAQLEFTTAFVALAEGRLTDARAALLHAVELQPASVNVGRNLAGRSALWARDGASAREDAAAIDAAGVHGPAMEADRTALRAGIAALEGRRDDAMRLYRMALRAWSDLSCAWDEAITGVDMAMLLEPADPEVRAVAERSREILVGLGARPFVERLDSAMAAPLSARVWGATPA